MVQTNQGAVWWGPRIKKPALAAGGQKRETQIRTLC